ncbi:hypothetical protein BC830DRAFT_1076995 [Chytriomyces sp. MP71]|nr:hypothetical protein BC830DRAFT_1076995 [Chytriomyces sp. MP71]
MATSLQRETLQNAVSEHQINSEDPSSRRQLTQSRSQIDVVVGQSQPPKSQEGTKVKELALSWVFLIVRAVDMIELLGASSDLGDLHPQVSDHLKLLDDFRTGVLACKIMNKINPGIISRITEGSSLSAMSSLENLASFSAALITYGVLRKHIFRPLEFVQANPKGDESFLKNILQLALLAHDKGFRHNGSFDAVAAKDALDFKTNVDISSSQLFTTNVLVNPMNSSQPVSSPVVQAEGTFVPVIMKTLELVEESLTKSLEATTSRLNKLQSDNLILAEELLKNVDIVTKRLSAIEAMQARINSQLTSLSDQQHGANRNSTRTSILARSVSDLSGGRPSDIRRDSESHHANNQSITSSPPPIGIPTPKLYPKLPALVVNAGLPKQEMMRLSVVYELIETEADYIRDLGIMINLHKHELLLWKVIDDATSESIFSNAEALIVANQGLLDRLNVKKEQNPIAEDVGTWRFMEEISDAFLGANDDFDAYMAYCGNYPVAMKLVHKLQSEEKFKHQMQQLVANPASRGLSLESFLIKPVQRICKYPLLLRELIKHTPKTMRDYAGLEKATEKMESIAAKVNEATQALDKKEKVISLLSKIESSIPLPYQDKKLLMEGVCQMNKSRERHLTLFKDVLIVSKITGKGRYSVDHVYQVYELVLIKSNAHAPESLLRYNAKSTIYLQYFLDKREISFTFADDSSYIRWLEAFKASINDPEAVLKRRIEPTASQDNSPTPGISALGKTASGVFKKSMLPSAFSGKGTSPKPLLSADSQTHIHSEISQEATYDQEDSYLPASVEIDGAIWKKALSAKSGAYYFNPETKETIWQLPESYKAIDGGTGRGTQSSSKRTSGDKDKWRSWVDLDGTETVDGFPDWRYVAQDVEIPYYVNLVTSESSWVSPHPNPPPTPSDS